VARRTIRIGHPSAPREVTVDVHDQDAEPWGLDGRPNVVGTAVPRVDGLPKANGTAKYAYDVARPRMAFARALRCPHAHARVKSVDVSAAERIPGVLAAARLGGPRVTYAGQVVAGVCAEKETVLDDALAAIRVEYEVLPHVVDATEALDPASPRVDESRENRVPEQGGGRGGGARGDPDRAIAQAPVKVTAEYRTHVQNHVPLEPHVSVAEFDAEGNLTVWCSTQAASGVRNDVAQTAGLPVPRVRVLAEYMGGGFGCKLGLEGADRMAIQFAKATGRPVQCANDRRGQHLVGGNRPDSVQRLTIAGERDGTITALLATSYGTGGNGGGARANNTLLYAIPNVRSEQTTVATFAGNQRAFRAPGHPQGVFAQESAVDEFAHAIGMDPLAVRKKNDRHPARSIEWDVGADRIGWARNRRPMPGSDPGPVKRGLGCAGGRWGNSGGGSWQVQVVLGRDGSVVARSGTQDIGTGTKTVIAILVAEELGIPPQGVTVRIGDTNHPPGPNSGGSQTAASIGPAAREAGLRAREVLQDLLALEWKCDPGDVRFSPTGIVGPGGRSTTFLQACGLLRPEGVTVVGERRPNWRESFQNEVGGCQFAQVAVDVETGVVRVEKVVAVHDAGRIVDPLTARNQVNGGVIQGISYALLEERLLDRATGDMVNPTHDTYRIAGMQDCPEIDVVLMPIVEGINSVGMVGLGEPATVPTAAAVANAVFNAIGVRVREIPMTPARVLAALRSAKNGGRR
jgi:xanthine dehydrogenase YagR molybdenum-binding subunit